MTDITTRNLEAAILDQKAAGAFEGLTYAFVPVVEGDGWELGVAVANERGYSPIKGKTFRSKDEAREWADGLNRHIGLDEDEAWKIICSTMGGRPYLSYPKVKQ